MSLSPVVLVASFLVAMAALSSAYDPFPKFTGPAADVDEFLSRRLTGGIDTMVLPSMTARYFLLVGSTNLFMPRLVSDGQILFKTLNYREDRSNLNIKFELTITDLRVLGIFVPRFLIFFSIGTFDAPKIKNKITGEIVVKTDSCSIELKTLEVPALELSPQIYDCTYCHWLYGVGTLRKLAVKAGSHATRQLHSTLYNYFSTAKIYSIRGCANEP